MKNEYKFKYIDLFAGIGGFHQAMRSLGGKCIMASEINQNSISVYKKNFSKTEVRGNIRDISPSSIDKFDVLCAGFPCQSFSKAGLQKGFEDEERGDLFYYIIDILKHHPEVKFVVLENVRNLADKKENWEIIKKELINCGFIITENPVILSPSDFGIPQIRERVYILGVRKEWKNENILKNGYIHIDDLEIQKHKKKCKIGSAWNILEDKVSEVYYLKEHEMRMLYAWDEFKSKTNIKVIGYPIWVDYFGDEFDDDEEFKKSVGYYEMKRWKQNFVEKNRALYLNNKEYIDNWIKEYDIKNQIKLYKKFEWNCGTDCNSLKEGIIQVRQSGIRVKRPNFFPSLVAMGNTPIVWDSKVEKYRRISPREAANLQSFNRRFKLAESDGQAYEQLGNSVNVRVIKILAKALFKLGKVNWEGVNDDEE